MLNSKRKKEEKKGASVIPPTEEIEAELTSRLQQVYDDLVEADEMSETEEPDDTDAEQLEKEALCCIANDLMNSQDFVGKFVTAMHADMDWLHWSTRETIRIMQSAINKSETLRSINNWVFVDGL